MIFLNKFIALIFFILSAAAASASTPSFECSKALFVDTFDARQEAADINTTSLRREMKIVADQQWVQAFLQNLALSFGELVPRDRAPVGRSNVTSTDYLQRFRTPNTDGTMRVAKIRLRRYYERLDGTPLAAAISGAWPEDLVKMEFKVDHPTALGVVNKHTIILTAKDVDTLLLNEESYIYSRQDILARATTLVDPTTGKHNSRRLTEHMLQSLGQLYRHNISLARLINIRYEREAYKLDLTDLNTGLKVPIQMTVDHDIQYRQATDSLLESSQGLGPVLTSYPQNHYVVEIKIPLVFADLDHPFWKQSKLHITFVEEIRELLRHQAPWIPTDHGKLSARDYLEQISTENP